MKKIFYPLIAGITVPAYIGYNYYRESELASRAHLESKLKEKIEKVGEDDISVAELYEKLGQSEEKNSNFVEASINYKKAIKIHESFGETSTKELEILYKNLSKCFKSLDKYDDYILALKKSFEWKFKIFDRLDNRVLEEYKNLAKEFSKLGRKEEELECYSNLINVLNTLVMADSNEQSELNLKKLHVESILLQGKFYLTDFEAYDKVKLNRARGILEEAASLIEKYDIQNEVSSSEIYFQLARAYFYLNKIDNALTNCKEVFRILDQHKSFKNNPYFYCSSITGSDYLHRGNVTLAENFLKMSIDSFGDLNNEDLEWKSLEENKTQLSKTFANLGLTIYKQKKSDSSITYYQTALEILGKVRTDTDRDYLAIRFNLAVALLEAGNTKEAWDVVSDVYLKCKSKYGDTYPLTTSALQLINKFTGIN